jgi:50S ribosomal protein L16 3-hydroxylase
VNKKIPGGMDAAEFLRTYWQKKPCFIRNADNNFQSFISRDELFALACQDKVESRLVLEIDGDIPWQVAHGPFQKEDFSNLPESHWALLVQNTDLHLPAASSFLESFNFIPNWRIDDLMISYAPENGSVGPHLDSYDVFLFQAMGKRRWSINNLDYDENDFIEGLDLRVIENFIPEQEWFLEPGDMLYLPPNIAHHGVALEECMTYSIGFRAPSNHEIISRYVDDLLYSEKEQRYTDPNLTVSAHSGEISEKHLQDIVTFTKSIIPDEKKLEDWFGKFVTQLPENCQDEEITQYLDADSFFSLVQNKKYLLRCSASRTVFIRKNDFIILFVNGESYTLPSSYEQFAFDFTEKHKFENPLINKNRLDPELTILLCRFYNMGIINDGTD